MKKIAITGLLLILISGFGLAQKTIEFTETHHNFGTIKEEAGNVVHSFTFKNTGNIPLLIQNVKASCGCTAPKWTKAPIAPGQEGEIEITFNPLRRPGPFTKTINVFTTGTPASIRLVVSGKVIERPKTIADYYPRLIGDQNFGQLRLKRSVIPFYKITNKEIKTDSFAVVNVWDKPIKVGLRNIPEHISYKSEPEILQPNQKGSLIVTYNAEKKNDWGAVYDYLYLTINDKVVNNSRVSISADISQDFSKLSEKDLANAPKIDFKQTVYDFGTIGQNKKIEFEFEFTNNGKSDLLLHKIKATCGCTTVNPSKNIIKPGESSSLKAIFNSGTFSGKQSKYITVISNDPKQPEVRLRLTGNVVNN